MALPWLECVQGSPLKALRQIERHTTRCHLRTQLRCSNKTKKEAAVGCAGLQFRQGTLSLEVVRHGCHSRRRGVGT